MASVNKMWLIDNLFSPYTSVYTPPSTLFTPPLPLRSPNTICPPSHPLQSNRMSPDKCPEMIQSLSVVSRTTTEEFNCIVFTSWIHILEPSHNFLFILCNTLAIFNCVKPGNDIIDCEDVESKIYALWVPDTGLYEFPRPWSLSWFYSRHSRILRKTLVPYDKHHKHMRILWIVEQGSNHVNMSVAWVIEWHPCHQWTTKLGLGVRRVVRVSCILFTIVECIHEREYSNWIIKCGLQWCISYCTWQMF